MIVLAATAAALAVALVLQFQPVPATQGAAGSAAGPRAALAQGIIVPGDTPAPRTGISVTGEGRVTVEPDTAQISLGVEISNPSASAAQQQAASAMNAVVAEIKKQGIEDRDIQTVRYDLSPEYDYSTRSPVLRGYRATNIVMVKMRDISKVGATLDAVAASGATRIHGISFSVSDPTAATTRGREEAMKDARSKADQLAGTAGVSVGAPIAIEEISATPPPPVEMAPRVAAPAAAPEQTPISPGTREVRVIVRVVYDIK